MVEIHHYEDFVAALLNAGFSMGGGKSDGIFALIPWSWNEAPPYDTPVRWHTEDPQTDPWEWRIRVLDERDDVAYAKLFFKKSGYLTKEWYPYFLSARRGGRSFEEEYESGKASQYAKRVYQAIVESGVLAVDAIRACAGFSKEDKPKIERALIELQMKMFITMCGRRHKMSKAGEQYGWSSTVFCTTESFFGEEVFQKAMKISSMEAMETIAAQVLHLNPMAEEKKILQFIKG